VRPKKVKDDLCLAEQRIINKTNYYEEICHFFPNAKFIFYFVGPEISSKVHLKYANKLDGRLKVEYYKGTVGEFISGIVIIILESKDLTLEGDSTLCVGFNPGYGAGFAKLTESWLKDIHVLLKMKLFVLFTQANDYCVSNQ
jgi:hypothetical protein